MLVLSQVNANSVVLPPQLPLLVELVWPVISKILVLVKYVQQTVGLAVHLVILDV